MTNLVRAVRVCSLALAGLALSTAAYAEPQVITLSPSFPAAEEYANLNYDRSDQLKVTGRIEHVDALNGETIVWVHATKVEQSSARVRPGTEAPGKGEIWRVAGPGLAKIKDADRARLVQGSDIVVIGSNGADKTCEPTCRISSSKVTLK
jgi:hypothetical protein